LPCILLVAQNIGHAQKWIHLGLEPFRFSWISLSMGFKRTRFLRTSFLTLVVLVGLNLSACRNNQVGPIEAIDTTVQFVSRGLQGFSVYSIRESKKYIYACTQRDGLFRILKSDLGSGYWEYLGLKTNALGTHGVLDVAVFGDNDDLILAGIGNDKEGFPGLLRSTDQGLTWIASDSNLVGGYTGIPSLTQIHSATYFAVSPITPGLIFTCNWWNSAVFWTHDYGADWSRTANTSLDGYFIGIIETEPQRPERVWAAGWLQRSTDSGVSWLFVNTYSDNFPVHVITSMVFGNIGEVYISQLDRVVRSTDDGSTWSMFLKADSTVTITSVLVDPKCVDHVLVSGETLTRNPKGVLLSKQTILYEFAGGSLKRVHVCDGVIISNRLRVLDDGRLFFGTDEDGIQEVTNLLKP